MNPDYQTIADFLQYLGPEVSGRETGEPENGEAERLERFARGECDETERAQVCRLLRSHPLWLRWLANRVRLARSASVKS